MKAGMKAVQLSAGRELDALVAEKVMGWDVLKYDNGTIIIVERDQGEIFCYQIDADDKIDHAIWWSPSTRINDAMQAYDAIKDEWYIEIGYASVTEPIAGFGVGWYAMMWPRGREMKVDDWPQAYSEDNLAEAICLAVLKAVEMEAT